MKLTPQLTFALISALSLVVIYLFYTMVVKPKQDEITMLQDQLTTKQTTLNEYQANAAALPALRTEVGTLERERADFVRALPLTANFGQVVDQIRSTVAANDATLNSLTFAAAQPATGEGAPPAGVRPMRVTLNVDGEYAKQFRILRNLETQNRFTNINDLSLQMPNEVTNFDPVLTNTMNITVYTFDPAQAAPAAATTDGAAPAPAAPAAPTAGGN